MWLSGRKNIGGRESDHMTYFVGFVFGVVVCALTIMCWALCKADKRDGDKDE